jgi:hypothetical protein
MGDSATFGGVTVPIDGWEVTKDGKTFMRGLSRADARAIGEAEVKRERRRLRRLANRFEGT